MNTGGWRCHSFTDRAQFPLFPELLPGDNVAFTFLSEGLMTTRFLSLLETFENQFPDRNYRIRICCPEFTSVCPKTGQPDFGKLTFDYIAAKLCVELKSLKVYLQAFRNEGIFYEHVTNSILDDFAAAVQPREVILTAEFTPRGGISSTIIARWPE
jgi:7-cyano-7-deazaguanine reductase